MVAKHERTKNYIVMRIETPKYYNWEKMIENKKIILFSDSVDFYPDVSFLIPRDKILLCASCSRKHLGKEFFRKNRDIVVGYGFIYDVISLGAKIIIEFDRETIDQVIDLLQHIKRNIE